MLLISVVLAVWVIVFMFALVLCRAAAMADRALEGDEVAPETVRRARRWGLFHRFVIGDGKTTYLDRLSLITTPWFSIKLHRIYRPDQQRDLHDHPWDFVSFPLWGSYIEDVPHKCGGRCWQCLMGTDGRLIRWFNFKRAEDRHSIRWVSRTPVWTLVFCGPRRRQWGFYTKQGWVSWDKYDVQP